jgi:hypothetical protein
MDNIRFDALATLLCVAAFVILWKVAEGRLHGWRRIIVSSNLGVASVSCAFACANLCLMGRVSGEKPSFYAMFAIFGAAVFFTTFPAACFFDLLSKAPGIHGLWRTAAAIALIATPLFVLVYKHPSLRWV